MIHIRGAWLNNGSMRSRRRAERARLEESKRQIISDLMALSQLGTVLFSKREARLMQSQQYRQNGGQ